MGLKEAVKRLEAATCANEVCFICASLDAGERAFRDVLKRYGVNVDALPQDPEEFFCPECGAARIFNVHDADEGLREEWRAFNASSWRNLTARGAPSKDERQKFDELNERDRERLARFYGEHFEEAHEASLAATFAWLDEHEAEVIRALDRPSLAQRRGLAA